ncbi:alpha/beta fold hydrolase [Methanobacterium sp.]|uniref:alpha/beta fold hydrolase n=1 Tax=Methanobacterium sp. TaxID=2164 RepID=UPI003C73A3DF
MPTVKVNDVDMYYEIHGKGEQLIFIQGLGTEISSAYLFTAELAKNYRVITFDNRGTGRTDKPDVCYSIEMMAEDTIGLMDELGIKRAHFMGGSMGACILQVIGAKHPERVNSMVLYLATPQFSDTLKNAMKPFLKLQRAEKEQINQIHPLFMQKYPPTPESLSRQLEANMKFDGRGLLSQIKAPTLIINATKDLFIPMENTEELAEGIPHAKMVLVDGDHLFPMTKSELLIKHAVTFLEYLRAN